MPTTRNRVDRESSGPGLGAISEFVSSPAHSESDVNATAAAETPVVTLAIPTNLAAGDRIRLICGGTVVNNTAGSLNYTWRFKIGTTTVMDMAAAALAQSANSRKWYMDVMTALVSTSSERCAGNLRVSNAVTTGFGAVGGADLNGYGTAAEDLTSVKNVVVSIEISGTGSTATCAFSGLEIIRA